MARLARGSFSGSKEVKKALADADKKLRRKVLRKASAAGTRIQLKAVKANTPTESGLAKKSLGRKTVTYRGSGTVVGIVGPRKGFGKEVMIDGHAEYRDPVKYFYLIEFGTVHSAAQAPMRKAYDETRNEVERAMASKIQDEMGT